VPRIAVATDVSMPSVRNVAREMSRTFKRLGCDVDILHFRRPQLREAYDLVVMWVPFTLWFVERLVLWIPMVKSRRPVLYTVIEGIVPHIRRLVAMLSNKRIITPSHFSKRLVEEMGCRVVEVIPHQLTLPLPVDHHFGRKWRAQFPRNKKLFLYVGGSINRKALPKLRRAIDILWRRGRRDFHVVVHMDDTDWDFCTKAREMEGVATRVETEFGTMTLERVYAKIKYADFLVHPAVGEGFGLPVAEAMALGTVPVCVAAPAVNELANPLNSFMVTEVWPSQMAWKDHVVFRTVDYRSEALANQIMGRR